MGRGVLGFSEIGIGNNRIHSSWGSLLAVGYLFPAFGGNEFSVSKGTHLCHQIINHKFRSTGYYTILRGEKKTFSRIWCWNLLFFFYVGMNFSIFSLFGFTIIIKKNLLSSSPSQRTWFYTIDTAQQLRKVLHHYTFFTNQFPFGKDKSLI